MKSRRISKSIYSAKYSIFEFFSQNKFYFIICALFCLVGLLTGIFTAVKIFNLGEEEIFESFNITYQLEDLENFSSNFFGRLLSYEIVLILLFIFSLNPALYIFGWCLLAYRAFLITINCVMIILIFSFNGIIKSLLIILPCQILMLAVLMLFFCYMCKRMKINKFLKCGKFSNILFPILLASLCLSLINLLETLLLLIFRSSVILVI